MSPSILTLICLCLYGAQVTLSDKSDVGLGPGEMIANHGYPSETHYITTEDGYILTFNRIPHGINDDGTAKRPAVIVMHGITSSSADFVAMGPGRGLGYILADSGYDVWLGNCRGNAFSRNHTTIDINVDPVKFYNFTWHEMGYYDLADSIDYILDLNGDDSLHFVGHSQGTTTFLVLTSTRPEYNQKIKLASLMAAAAIVKHYQNTFLQTLINYLDTVELLLERYKIYEVPLTTAEREFVTNLCADMTDPMCDDIYHNKFPYDQAEPEYIPIIYTNNPSNAGMKQYVHFGQQVRDGGFRYFDYGPEKNLEVYGSEAPPDYDLSKISVPVAIYYAKDDHTVPPEDEEKLMTMIPNLVNKYLVPDDLYGHGDFLYNKNNVILVFNELLEMMGKY